ncbi:uncharacterized protein LOC141705895 isoform X2 [Apium graveolens]|uniref:uncharacterized protein LOC141705895 isoform X2 n=1 Tax=Apium graveolens TaxID=4045 RepID=UPI003D7A43C4
MAITKVENPSNQPSSSSSSSSSRPRWGDVDDDNDDYLLPPREVIGPDENGIKKVIEYKLNHENKLVRVTTTSRVRKLVANARVSKHVVQRRAWTKFGDALDEGVGANLTMVSTEAIFLERPAPYGTCCFLPQVAFYKLLCKLVDMLLTGSKVEESNSTTELRTGGALMVCRTCGKKGDHWSARCPYKDLNQPIETFSEKPGTSDVISANGVTKAAYVPPNLRRGAERTSGSDMRRRTEENSVRVTNLSEDTREADLNELCRNIGPVTRTYVSTDQRTGVCRGFGFVNFLNREDAEKAIKVLNGYGYDNLILHVEWAAPRTN